MKVGWIPALSSYKGVEELGQNGALGGHLGQFHVVRLGGNDASASVCQSLKSTPEYFFTASTMVRRSQWLISICLPDTE